MIRRRAATMALWTLMSLVVPAGCSSDPGSRVAFCREARRTPDLSATLSGFTDADPAELDTRLAVARRSYDRLRRAAPEPIRSDTKTVVDMVGDVINAVRDHPDDPDAAVVQVRRSVASRPDITKAARAVTAYAAQACQLELDPATSTTAPATATSSVPAPN